MFSPDAASRKVVLVGGGLCGWMCDKVRGGGMVFGAFRNGY